MPLSRLLVCSMLLGGAFAVVAGEAAPAYADRAHDAEVQRLFRRSAQAYARGRYAEAVTTLEQLYALQPTPILQFNLGRALEKVQRLPEAIVAYQTYLELQPDAKDRATLEQHIAVLRLLQESNKDALLTPHPDGTHFPHVTPPPEPAPTPPIVEAPRPMPVAVAIAVPPAPPTRVPVYKRWWLWTTVGVVAAAGLGIGLGIGLTRPDSFSATLAPIARP